MADTTVFLTIWENPEQPLVLIVLICLSEIMFFSYMVDGFYY